MIRWPFTPKVAMFRPSKPHTTASKGSEKSARELTSSISTFYFFFFFLTGLGVARGVVVMYL
jgi:hypothetical protein